MSLAQLTEKSNEPSANWRVAASFVQGGTSALDIHPWLHRIVSVLHGIAFEVPQSRKAQRRAIVEEVAERTTTPIALFKEFQCGTRNARVYQVAGRYEVHLYDAADDFQDRQIIDSESSALHTAFTWCK